MRNENIRIFGAGYWREGRDNNVKYQTMINEVLDKYVQKYKDRIII
jgi:hypothetical protein